VPAHCHDRVRYVGEPVAIVVAEDRDVVDDALDLIQTTYEVLPAVIDPLKALDQTRQPCIQA
jgi:2-furoyl-CoA dehydrogenase large subunit